MSDPSTSDAPDALLHKLRAAMALTLHVSGDLLTVRDLARHLAVSRSVLTRVFGRLSGLGLMRRKVNPLDRRSLVVVRKGAGQAAEQELAAWTAGGLLVRAWRDFWWWRLRPRPKPRTCSAPSTVTALLEHQPLPSMPVRMMA
jgi:DNA-binding MarR family transcriptional regulator